MSVHMCEILNNILFKCPDRREASVCARVQISVSVILGASQLTRKILKQCSSHTGLLSSVICGCCLDMTSGDTNSQPCWQILWRQGATDVQSILNFDVHRSMKHPKRRLQVLKKHNCPCWQSFWVCKEALVNYSLLQGFLVCRNLRGE